MSIDIRAGLVADVNHAQDALFEARLALTAFDIKPKVATIRKHPAKELFAVWSGTRWFVFADNATGADTYAGNSYSAKWGGFTIEEWDLYRT